jgi:6-phosphogluconolactonase
LLPGRSESRDLESFVVAVKSTGKEPDRVSVGARTIRAAREIWVVATGQEKAEIVRRLLREHPSPDECPAGWILKAGGPVVFFLDEASASRLA